MNWNFLITFAICLGCYFVGLAIFTIIKYNIHKKKFKKEIKEHVKIEDKNAINDSKSDSVKGSK